MSSQSSPQVPRGTGPTSPGQAPDEVGRELAERVAQVRAGIEVAGERLDPQARDRAHADLERVVHRLELGVDHAVVALVGGTGSGKSSMFNAISTLDFADVGVIRPTTSEAAACVWGPGADRLLDFLEVAPGRRIARESVLTASDEAELRGMVLLDLPDHDSVQAGHAKLVDRLLPLVDLLIWVVDPQKYADNALHEGYLRELSDRHEAMLVVVNQVDTLTDAGREAVRGDVRRLLTEDGLADVPVVLASARTGLGISEIRTHLHTLMSTESTAARTARDELSAVGRRLSAGIASSEPSLPMTPQTATSLAEAAGVPAVATAIASAIISPRPVAMSTVRRPARSRIDAIRDQWLTGATDGLPSRWRTAMRSSVAPGADFFERTASALEGVGTPSLRDRGATVMRLGGLVALGLGVAAVLAGVIVLLGFDEQTLGIVVGAGGLVLAIAGIALVVAAGRRRRETARKRSEGYVRDVSDAVGAVVETDLVAPATTVLDEHRKVRRLVLDAP